MSESHNTERSLTGAETGSRGRAAVSSDPDLVRLVRFINALDGAEIGVTLHVGGCVVSGMLISMAQFYRMLVREIADSNKLSKHSDRDAAESFAKFYSSPLDNAEKALKDYRESNKVPPLPRHIHLRYVQTLVTGGQPLTQSLWRGRLTKIDGWSIGNFGPIPRLGDDKSPED